jgi:hypothetical protein
MRYKPKCVAALQVALGGLPDAMRVEVEEDIGGITATNVGELRHIDAWPNNLVVTTPQEHLPETTIKVCKASGSKRATPKP